MRIAFAGSDTWPAHDGHRQVVEEVLRSGLFDHVIWIPSGFSVWKMDPNLRNRLHRQQMAMLAFPQEWLYRPKPGWATFQIDLSAVMQQDVPTGFRFHLLREQYPGAEITFITGSDAVSAEIPSAPMPILQWSHQALLERERILIMQRDGFLLKRHNMTLPPFVEWFPSETIFPDVRSSQLRKLIRLGDISWKNYVREEIQAYIDLHQLFMEREY